MAASKNFPSLPSDWSEQQIYLRNEKLFLRVFKKNRVEFSRWLFVVHGQGEQSDRYTHFPFYLNSTFDAIVAIDLPGHGKSKGIRGHIENFDQYSQACLEAFQHCKNLLQMKEAHWFGHSMGGLITLRTLLKKSDLGLTSSAVCAPLLGLAMKPPVLKKLFGILIEPILGRLPLKNELDPKLLSHDPSVQTLYVENPLNHSFVTSRFFVQMNREMELLKSPLSEYGYPLMIISPLADEIVSWKAGLSFFERIKMKAGFKKEYQSFPNFNHEAFNEIGKERVFLALENWVLKNSK